MGIQTSLDGLRAAGRIVDAMRLADELAFESSRDPGVRTIRVLTAALEDTDQLSAIAACSRTKSRSLESSRTSTRDASSSAIVPSACTAAIADS